MRYEGGGEISQKYLGQRGGVAAAIANSYKVYLRGEGQRDITIPIHPTTSDAFSDICLL